MSSVSQVGQRLHHRTVVDASVSMVLDAPNALRRSRSDTDVTTRPSKRRRLSIPGGCGRRRAAVPASPQVGNRRRVADEGCAAATSAGAFPLAALADGPYFVVASYLGFDGLSCVDATCRALLALNGLPSGPWHTSGNNAFFGMELDVGGGFLPFEKEHTTDMRPSAHIARKWKSLCELFHTEAPTFSQPFGGAEISSVEHPDEVAYCRCRLRTDLLANYADRGIYVEVDVAANADNLSLAVVDFEGGGRSSVTFSPETGAVLRERKVRELPRAIEGTYIHLLPAAQPGRRFEGTMGLFLRGGHLAFYRRWSGTAEEGDRAAGSRASATPGPWETTGFCTDLSWAQGPRLSLCLAFRDDGAYHVRVTRVCRTPPCEPTRSAEAYREDKWSLLYGDDDHPLAI